MVHIFNSSFFEQKTMFRFFLYVKNYLLPSLPLLHWLGGPQRSSPNKNGKKREFYLPNAYLILKNIKEGRMIHPTEPRIRSNLYYSNNARTLRGYTGRFAELAIFAA